MLNVLMIDPHKILFEGTAHKIILPGEQGVFEVLSHHKRIISRLFTGNINIDEKAYSIKRGLVTVEQDKVTIIAETEDVGK